MCLDPALFWVRLPGDAYRLTAYQLHKTGGKTDLKECTLGEDFLCFRGILMK